MRCPEADPDNGRSDPRAPSRNSGAGATAVTPHLHQRPARWHAATMRASRAPPRGREWPLQESAAPGLEVEKRPDQQAAVLFAFEMFVDERQHRWLVEELPETRLPLVQRPAHVFDAL